MEYQLWSSLRLIKYVLLDIIQDLD